MKKTDMGRQIQCLFYKFYAHILMEPRTMYYTMNAWQHFYVKVTQRITHECPSSVPQMLTETYGVPGMSSWFRKGSRLPLSP